MTLNELKNGESGVVVKVHGHGAFRKRIVEMGFTRGRCITRELSAPLKDPVKYKLMGYEILLRSSEARLIEILPIDNDRFSFSHISEFTAEDKPDTEIIKKVEEHIRTINVALIGNPNCGKTSLFNEASGSNEHVGNYSGVTVDAKTASFNFKGYKINLVDLPGTYSLSAYSPEERYVRTYLRDHNPDIILNVVNAGSLERNLYLTTELIDMNRPMVIALNMFDEMRKSGKVLDFTTLGKMIGVPMVPTVFRTGKGINDLFDTVIRIYERKEETIRHVHISLGKDIEKEISALSSIIKEDKSLMQDFAYRYLAIKFLEKDEITETTLRESPVYPRLEKVRDEAVRRIERLTREDIPTLITNEKYGFIAGALAETMTESEDQSVNKSHIIDTVVTSRLFGFPFFFLLMFIVFWATFVIGAYPQEWMENGISLLCDYLNDTMSAGPVRDMIVNGAIGGVGGVIVFLPNILILFFFISMMEDTGYMARAAFIMDSLMHKIGLHGKSFIPLVMGFGCNVPAIMAARAIESRSSRIVTILINPFMSCSARLPLYVLLIGTFFSAHAALIFLGLYITGIAVAVLSAKLIRLLWFKQDETPFVMELPPYRIPTLRTISKHTWEKGREYLKKMGGIILLGSLVVWALNYFPLRDEESSTPEQTEIESKTESKGSYAQQIGEALTPVMEPIGIHWRGTVALFAGIPAKEIIVSTLGVLFTGDEEATDHDLSKSLTSVNPETGKPFFGQASALAFMVFALLYCPCLATIVAIAKETGGWKYALFSVFYNTSVAWIAAWLVYRFALLFA